MAAAETWTVENASAIKFTDYQEGAPVEGRFDDFIADIMFAPDDLAASRVEVGIDTASITTGHKDRDTTLRSSSFFNVKTWPTAAFVSDRLVHEGGDTYAAHGQLTIRDVTKDVVPAIRADLRGAGRQQGRPRHRRAHDLAPRLRGRSG